MLVPQPLSPTLSPLDAVRQEQGDAKQMSSMLASDRVPGAEVHLSPLVIGKDSQTYTTPPPPPPPHRAAPYRCGETRLAPYPCLTTSVGVLPSRSPLCWDLTERLASRYTFLKDHPPQLHSQLYIYMTECVHVFFRGIPPSHR